MRWVLTIGQPHFESDWISRYMCSTLVHFINLWGILLSQIGTRVFSCLNLAQVILSYVAVCALRSQTLFLRTRDLYLCGVNPDLTYILHHASVSFRGQCYWHGAVHAELLAVDTECLICPKI